MKTVNEMLLMSEKYPVSFSFGIGGFTPPFELIVSELAKDEDVILAFRSVVQIGKVSYVNAAVAFTTRRILLAGKPGSTIGLFMAPGVQSVSYTKYTSVGIFGMDIRLASIGDEDITFGSYKSEIRETLRKEIQQIIENYQSTITQGITTAVQKSPAEEVKLLKELMDSGIITEEEFSKKKKELLGL